MKQNKILKDYKIKSKYAIPITCDLLQELGKKYSEENARKIIFMIKELDLE